MTTQARRASTAFQIRGADLGGAIFVNAYADDFRDLEQPPHQQPRQRWRRHPHRQSGDGPVCGAVVEIDSSPNPGVHIHHNEVIENGSLNGGGGISLFAGADDYVVEQNQLCGNFSRPRRRRHRSSWRQQPRPHRPQQHRFQRSLPG
jgi:hypothetical protein